MLNSKLVLELYRIVKFKIVNIVNRKTDFGTLKIKLSKSSLKTGF